MLRQRMGQSRSCRHDAGLPTRPRGPNEAPWLSALAHRCGRMATPPPAPDGCPPFSVSPGLPNSFRMITVCRVQGRRCSRRFPPHLGSFQNVAFPGGQHTRQKSGASHRTEWFGPYPNRDGLARPHRILSRGRSAVEAIGLVWAWAISKVISLNATSEIRPARRAGRHQAPANGWARSQR